MRGQVLEEVRAGFLAQLVHEKTSGNPFFAGLLREAVEELMDCLKSRRHHGVAAGHRVEETRGNASGPGTRVVTVRAAARHRVGKSDRGQRDGDLSGILPLVFVAWRVIAFLNIYWSRIARHARMFSRHTPAFLRALTDDLYPNYQYFPGR